MSLNYEKTTVVKGVAIAAAASMLISACSRTHKDIQPTPTVSTPPSLQFAFLCANYFQHSLTAERKPGDSQMTFKYDYSIQAPPGYDTTGAFQYEKIEEPGTTPGYVIEVQPLNTDFNETITATSIRISAGFVKVRNGTMNMEQLNDFLNSPAGYRSSGLEAQDCASAFEGIEPDTPPVVTTTA